MAEPKQPNDRETIAAYIDTLRTVRSAAIDGTLAATAQMRSTAKLVGSGTGFCEDLKTNEAMLFSRETLVMATGAMLGQIGVLSKGEMAQQDAILANAKDVRDSPPTLEAKETCRKTVPGLFPEPGR